MYKGIPLAVLFAAALCAGCQHNEEYVRKNGTQQQPPWYPPPAMSSAGIAANPVRGNGSTPAVPTSQTKVTEVNPNDVIVHGGKTYAVVPQTRGDIIDVPAGSLYRDGKIYVPVKRQDTATTPTAVPKQMPANPPLTRLPEPDKRTDLPPLPERADDEEVPKAVITGVTPRRDPPLPAADERKDVQEPPALLPKMNLPVAPTGPAVPVFPSVPPLSPAPTVPSLPQGTGPIITPPATILQAPTIATPRGVYIPTLPKAPEYPAVPPTLPPGR